jgi:hypothetical protein
MVGEDVYDMQAMLGSKRRERGCGGARWAIWLWAGQVELSSLFYSVSFSIF